jgi:DinB family protein
MGPPMIDLLKTMLTRQFEAALCMLKECIEKCPPEHFDGKIANVTFRQIAYHTLFFVDYDLSPNENAFQLREIHHRGGDERLPVVSAGLSKDETLAYVTICRQKLLQTMSSETSESLHGTSGFTRFPFSRGEMLLHCIRHVQHHTGQLSAFLRRIVEDGQRWWVFTGWR